MSIYEYTLKANKKESKSTNKHTKNKPSQKKHEIKKKKVKEYVTQLQK